MQYSRLASLELLQYCTVLASREDNNRLRVRLGNKIDRQTNHCVRRSVVGPGLHKVEEDRHFLVWLVFFLKTLLFFPLSLAQPTGIPARTLFASSVPLLRSWYLMGVTALEATTCSPTLPAPIQMVGHLKVKIQQLFTCLSCILTLCHLLELHLNSPTVNLAKNATLQRWACLLVPHVTSKYSSFSSTAATSQGVAWNGLIPAALPHPAHIACTFGRPRLELFKPHPLWLGLPLFCFPSTP